MIDKKRALNTIRVCIQHNNKNFKIKNNKMQQALLAKNFAIFKKNKTVAFNILKKNNLSLWLLKNV